MTERSYTIYKGFRLNELYLKILCITFGVSVICCQILGDMHAFICRWHSFNALVILEDTRRFSIQRVNSGSNRVKCLKFLWDSNPGYKIPKLCGELSNL